jgi:hypothetical protein
MKRLLSVLALLSILAIPAPTLTASYPTFLDAVKVLSVKADSDDSIEETIAKFHLGEWGDTNGPFINVCTVSSINRKAHYWITAAHCVTDIGPEGRYISEQPIEVIAADSQDDIAIVQSPAFARVDLKLGKAPQWNQDLYVAGHPFGYEGLFVTRGYVSNLSTNLGNDLFFMVFDVAGAPGNSGSPVMTLKGEVVSILQIGWGRSFSPITGGATYPTLNKYRRFFART